MPPRSRNALIGAAGEYYVAAELSRRDWLATVTIKNAPGTDILAQHIEQPGLLVSIQSKTTARTDSFVVGLGDEAVTTAQHDWYVFVLLRSTGERPDFYVMPRNHVAAFLWVSHRNWLANPGRGGHVRNDSSMRSLYVADIVPYRERWDALRSPTSEMAFEAPSWWQKATLRVSEHPEWVERSRLFGFD